MIPVQPAQPPAQDAPGDQQPGHVREAEAGAEPGDQVGTSEQFATAFALLARRAGLPTRLVVGFRPGDRQPDGTRVIRGRDALAWPEVYFQELGWVPFAPTPNDDTFTQGRPQLAEVLPAGERPPGQPLTVLYAPTWEGWTVNPYASSIATMGPALVRWLLERADPAT